MKTLTVAVFVLMCAAQWYVPGAMIASQERILADGIAYRFKTVPVDPTDPFRGKYITLNFADAFVELPGRTWQSGDEMFAIVEEDAEGFALISDVVDTPPDNMDYMRVTVAYGDERGVRLNLPFDRFYLEESLAPEAERMYRELLADSTQTVYAVVRIKEGRTTLQDVMVNDDRITDVVRGSMRAE